MISFFKKGASTVYAVQSSHKLAPAETEKLQWLLGAKRVRFNTLRGTFVGPRREMITPWSTNAVEITQNMDLTGIERIEEFTSVAQANPKHDKMLQRVYTVLDSHMFDITRKPDPIVHISDLEQYNQDEGLALSPEEIDYLKGLAQKLGRPLTDSEVFGFSQVNSEHCRHKIFGGTFIVDGEEMPVSLFSLIKKTTATHPNRVISAYKDNVAFLQGPTIQQFAPEQADVPSEFQVTDIKSVISLKAETHNFPTTVEPFNGAATGSGGEIRDRLGGGRASLPIAGTAVYMTSYPRLTDFRVGEQDSMPARPWLYQTPEEILIKASNGASDFGNKFGQPMICGSVLTFEHDEQGRQLAYDKVIMLAGGVGYAQERDAIKGHPAAGEKVVVMGGDNYRIGMGGGAVSSVNTGQYANAIELNAVQRANPEMQKRVSNVIRAMSEGENNPIVSIHDHGAGGHLNALSELVEETGGRINMGALPIGDQTLSAKEIIGNESQERMGFVAKEADLNYIETVAERERAPFYVVGETTGDDRFVFEQPDGVKPIDLGMGDMFGSSPKTVMTDVTVQQHYAAAATDPALINDYITDVLQLEAVACKDWLTNKVDRSVTGKIARQQCQGELQLPLSDCGVVALDYTGRSGIATSLGHAPQAGLIDSAAGSVLSIAEALTNIVGANLQGGLQAVSLSANWMWPCRNQGEDARLYRAVKACSDFAIGLGINIPTGKDSLSMTQKYGDKKVVAPGTVIISAGGEVADVRKTVSPVLQQRKSTIYRIDFSGTEPELGGSALYQSLAVVGDKAPAIKSPEYFANAFQAVQKLVDKGLLLAAHDVSAGGLLTTLLEMCFANVKGGLAIDLDPLNNNDIVKLLFAENPALVIQVASNHTVMVERMLTKAGVDFAAIGEPADERVVTVMHNGVERLFSVDDLREAWYLPSMNLDSQQTAGELATTRFENYWQQPLRWRMPQGFEGTLESLGLAGYSHKPSGVKAAIIRDKGVNGDREMAYSLYLAGFDVKDVHMTDLMTGRETLDDVNMIVFCGGFSNSDVLGSAKGWASGFVWNERAKQALDRFYARQDTLSLGICNGCQLMMELNLVTPGQKPIKMLHNNSHKFESAFLGLTIPENNSVMLGNLAGSKLGIWVAHGEGKFSIPSANTAFNVVAQYNYRSYPGNPNGSPRGIAGICSADGRHLAMMPHLERAIFPWQCGFYPTAGKKHEVTPWLQAFVNARKWVEQHK